MSMENRGGMMMLAKENSWLIYQSSLAIQPAESCDSKQEEWLKGMRVCPCKVFLFILASDFLHAVKSYDMGPPALLPLWRKVCCGFLLPLKVHCLGWFEPMNLGFNGKHTNHYISEATGTYITSMLLLFMLLIIITTTTIMCTCSEVQ
jgi:hypothetical protein